MEDIMEEPEGVARFSAIFRESRKLIEELRDRDDETLRKAAAYFSVVLRVAATGGRKGSSGCACILAEDDTILSICGAHENILLDVFSHPLRGIHDDIIDNAPYGPGPGNNDGKVRNANGDVVADALGHEGMAEGIAFMLNLAAGRYQPESFTLGSIDMDTSEIYVDGMRFDRSEDYTVIGVDEAKKHD